MAGALVETGDLFEPYYLSDAGGGRIGAVSAFLADLQAAGRPATTQRSYAYALLRWFRFTAAVGVPWDQVTRAEARVILSPASGRGSDLRGRVEVTVLHAAAAVFRFFA